MPRVASNHPETPIPPFLPFQLLMYSATSVAMPVTGDVLGHNFTRIPSALASQTAAGCTRESRPRVSSDSRTHCTDPGCSGHSTH